MRFLLDQNLPISLVTVLTELGHEALHVKPLGLAEATDREVWFEAGALGAIMVSKDSDFVSLVGSGGRLVRLRVGNCSNTELFAIVRAAWSNVVAQLDEGETLVNVHG